MSIRYSVRYVLQGRYQGLSLFDAAFDLTWLTCLSSQNGHLPGILRSPVQISCGTALAEAGVDLPVLQALMGHDHVDSSAAYIHLAPTHVRAAYDAARDRQRAWQAGR